ncbi:PREDICTED: cysteine proteinase-like [Papilio polytes]|uniref:cysteine proteinase-like n=1 Tax=Papilio polytes TaxID=76194 RepID=UPI0006766F03|nr:PREDICTED: cysteine proteinase-like [Papilio polytes]
MIREVITSRLDTTMKRLILITLLTISAIAAMEYNAESFYDYYQYREDRAEKISEDTEILEDNYESEKPKYDMKDAPQLFEKFVKDYSKVYKDENDRNKHYENFQSNLKDIIRTNEESKGFVVDINMFADLDKKEMESFYDVGDTGN